MNDPVFLNWIQSKNAKFNNTNKSPVKPAFDYDKPSDETVFLDSNWNDAALGPLRAFFYYSDIVCTHEPIKINNVVIYAICQNDQTYAMIQTPFDVLTISYYKNRGRTDSFVNSEYAIPITLDDLINFYEESGILVWYIAKNEPDLLSELFDTDQTQAIANVQALVTG